MAQNGGGSSRFQRVPAIGSRDPSPLLPITASTALSAGAVAASSVQTTQPHHLDRDVITLAQPRPGIDRVRNEYIETPLRPSAVPHHTHPSHRPLLPIVSKGGKLDVSGRISPCLAHTNLAGVHRSVSGPSSSLMVPRPNVQQRILSPAATNNTQLSLPITAQPKSGGGGNNRMIGGAFSKKDPSKSKSGVQGGLGDESLVAATHDDHQQSSIICHECKRCKCDACRKPRRLPATWICSRKYQCSAETIVESCSCMCCVKGLFYHCAKDCEMDDDVSCADRPCSCGSHRRCSRFACIGLLSAVLPCLLCYWPLRGCLRVCEVCYVKYHSHGCECVKRTTATAAAAIMTKRDARQRNKTATEPVQSGKSKRLLDAAID